MPFSHLFDVSVEFLYFVLLYFLTETKLYVFKYFYCLASDIAEETFSSGNLNSFITAYEDSASPHASKYCCNILEAHATQNGRSVDG